MLLVVVNDEEPEDQQPQEHTAYRARGPMEVPQGSGKSRQEQETR